MRIPCQRSLDRKRKRAACERESFLNLIIISLMMSVCDTYQGTHTPIVRPSSFLSTTHPKPSGNKAYTQGGSTEGGACTQQAYFSFFLGRSWLLWPHFFLRQLTARGCRRA